MRLDVTRAKNNQEAARTILETIQHERELAMWKRLQNAIGPPLKTKQYTSGRRRNAPPIDAPERAQITKASRLIWASTATAVAPPD
jgi:hypothetical protein